MGETMITIYETINGEITVQDTVKRLAKECKDDPELEKIRCCGRLDCGQCTTWNVRRCWYRIMKCCGVCCSRSQAEYEQKCKCLSDYCGFATCCCVVLVVILAGLIFVAI